MIQARFPCVVVTGASSGIGLELARILAPVSATLVIVARRLDRLENLQRELAVHALCRVVVIEHDLEAYDSAQALWNKVLTQGLKPTLWVNNAGFGLYGKSITTDLSREQAMIRLNVESLQTLTKLAAQAMLGWGGGSILNLASVAAFQPGPGMAVYFATKAFVLSYSQAVDEEFLGTGVRCFALCPGNTQSEFHQTAGTERAKWMHRLTQMTSKEVAQIAYFQILSGKRVVVPGLLNRIMVFFTRFMPMGLLTRISARVLNSD